MLLAVGTRLGPYEVLTPLGAGGMGEVYRARDTKLGRDVALKVLSASFVSDPERIARFEREAKTLASLNHPNIGGIHGLEETKGVTALILELVEGPTLADRIAQGALPLDEALPIAKQIAHALEAAHEQGIIHRDLKPANIKVRADGAVKVLDFGLAKAVAAAGGSSASLSISPTITSPVMTGANVLLGTAAYMAPEQARGKPVDRRADIWAFGCVLFEMLTGRQTFEGGETVSDVVAGILKNEPDWSALPANTPPHIHRLLRRCLQKDLQKRLPHVGLARIEIDDGQADGQAMQGVAASIPPAVPRWKRALTVGAFAVVAGGLGALGAWYATRQAPPPVARFAITLDTDRVLSGQGRRSIAISPDGSQIAFSSGRLFRRSLSNLESQLLVDADTRLGSPTNPAFSPDGQSIAYVSYQDRTLRRVSVEGGTPVTVCSLDAIPYGVSWDRSGIVFEADGSIMRVSADGGKPETLIAKRTSDRLRSPHLLPDGESVLFTLVDATANTRNISGSAYPARIVVQSLTSSEPRVLIENGMEATYLPTGHLAYVSGGVLFAVPFDARTLQVTGGPMPLVQGITSFGGTAYYAISATGSLVYVPGTESGTGGEQRLGLIDRSGKVDLLKLPPATFLYPRFSPDGSQVAVEIDNGNDADIWIYELSGATALRRLTFGGRNRVPAWSADGQRVAFQSDRDGDLAIFSQRADGAGPAERLTTPEKTAAHVPESWSLNGDLLFTATKGPDATLWTYSTRDRTSRPFGSVRASRQPTNAAFSPNGAWVAYQSNETGTPAVYVQPFPATGGRFQASPAARQGDPHHPLWSRDGRELFYVAGPNQFVVTAVTERSGLSFSNPMPIETGAWKNTFGGPTTIRNYDVSNDGKRFIGVLASGVTDSGNLRGPQINIVLNWFEELKQRRP